MSYSARRQEPEMPTSPKPAKPDTNSDYTRRLAQLDAESAANRAARTGYATVYDFTAIDEIIRERVQS
jgi:hypothetical protein